VVPTFFDLKMKFEHILSESNIDSPEYGGAVVKWFLIYLNEKI